MAVVALIMIDSSKTRKSLVGVEVQGPYAVEKHSKDHLFRYLKIVDHLWHISNICNAASFSLQ